MACAIGIWWSFQVARADYLFHLDTEESLREAIAIVPDQPRYYARLAQHETDHAERLLEKALSISRYDSQATIDLALLKEARGDYGSAEKLLLNAYAIDKTYLTRWTLANFYIRRDNMPEFWHWAHKAAEMPAEDIQALFQLCWRAAPDTSLISEKVLTADPQVTRQFIRFLLNRNELQAAASLATQLIARGRAAPDAPVLYALIDRLLTAGHAQAALDVWGALRNSGWVPSDAGVPYNSSFSRPPEPVAFDWHIYPADGLQPRMGQNGLEVEFSGRQPENCTIGEQVLALGSGAHILTYRYRTSGIAPDTGLAWKIADAKSGAVLATSHDMSSAEYREDSVDFPTSDPLTLVRLRLEYHRALGTSRFTGTADVGNVKLKASPIR